MELRSVLRLRGVVRLTSVAPHFLHRRVMKNLRGQVGKGGVLAHRRGGKRTPTALKVLSGTLRADRTPANEPHPEGVAECPEFLSAEARSEWARLAPELEALGLLTAFDVAVFAGYCQSWADFRKLTLQLNKMASWIWQSEKGYRQVCPEVSLRKDAWSRVLQAAARLGLDPATRSGMNVGLAVSKRANKFARRGRRADPNPFEEFTA